MIELKTAKLVAMQISLVTAALLWLNTVTAKSDCQCIDGFDPGELVFLWRSLRVVYNREANKREDAMPKMNVTNFLAAAYPNGSSM